MNDVQWAIGKRFADALAFAVEVHAGDVRKGTGVPYVSHLLAVASLVLDDGGSEDEAIAALLHDTAEDHGGEEMLDRIEQRFGARVREIVAACSDSLLPEGALKEEWRPRKERYLRAMEHKDGGTLRVALADKVHNAQAIVADYRLHGDELWQRFSTRSGEDQLWYYRSLVEVGRRLQPYDRLLAQLADAVDQLEAMIRAEAQVRGSRGARLGWVERAIADSRRYADEVGAEAAYDRIHYAPGTADYDWARSAGDEATYAEATVKRLEDERDEIVGRREQYRREQQEPL